MIRKTSFFVTAVFILCSQALGYTADDSEGTNISKNSESLLAAKKFDELDRIASSYRASEKKLRGGNSPLYHFYPGLTFVGKGDVYTGTLPASQKQALLEQWVEQSPKSVTAKIALAGFWNKQGWNVRGAKFAQHVSQEQWQVFRENLAIAERTLSSVDLKLDPYAYYLLIEIAQGKSVPRKELDSLYQRAIADFPDFFHFYSKRANLLFERWFGEPGEVAALASSVLKKPGGENGMIAYTYISMPLLVHDANQVFHSVGLSWPSIRDGYRARARKFGLRNRDWNAFFYFAALAGDAAVANEAFENIGEKWDSALWHDRNNFDSAVRWMQSAKSPAK